MLINVGLVVERSRYMIRKRYRNELEDAYTYIYIHMYICIYICIYVYTFILTYMCIYDIYIYILI